MLPPGGALMFDPRIVQRNELRRINFTQTFNPKKFTVTDTWLDGQELFRKQVKLGLCKHPEWEVWYVLEKHKNQRAHMHGQVILKNILQYPMDVEYYFKLISKLTGVMSKLGICDVKWNDPTVKEDEDWPTYTDYCLKETKDVIYFKNDSEPRHPQYVNLKSF